MIARNTPTGLLQRSLLLLATVVGVGVAAPSSVRGQDANEIEAIREDVDELQKLVREIEGRLFVLAQRLKKLPASTPTNKAIDKRAEILKQIFAALNVLRAEAKTKPVKINVTVNGDGNVILKGYVADTDQLKRVLEIVRKVPGVKGIINELVIGKPVDPKTTTGTYRNSEPVDLIGSLIRRAMQASNEVSQAASVDDQ